MIMLIYENYQKILVHRFVTMETVVKLNRRHFVYALSLSVFVLLLIPPEQVEAKTATKSGGIVTATKVAGTSGTSQDVTGPDGTGLYVNGGVGVKANLTALEKLKRDIFAGYDKAVPPVLDHRHRVDVEVDMTYRQVLDLDEKNQILKSLIWYRQYWTDEHLKWEPEDYDGIVKLSVPATNVWRPDITVYEEVGSRDLNPRLPFVELRHSGQILYAEPTILETSCSVNTAFFPFDKQKCTITFVSWTQSVKYIDLKSQRTADILEAESLNYFIDSGEWVLEKFGVTKQIATYNTIQQAEPATSTKSSTPLTTADNTTQEAILANSSLSDSITADNITQETRPANASHSDSTTADNITQETILATASLPDSGDKTTVANDILTLSGTYKITSQEKLLTRMPATQSTTAEAIGKELTQKMYAEVMFSLVVRRNSSLYMQSMLFPSILLTTVALLGFFLPPDSGERVGLQITILLTFMVFLLTVGEMFPASTGPYIGIYFVLSMAQLGINILFTIIVLHIHFKPCVRDKSTWKSDRPQWYSIGGIVYEGDSMIPVRTRRVLQFFAKYFNVADPGAVWTWPISDPTGFEEGSRYSEKSSINSPDSDSILRSNTAINVDVQTPSTGDPATDSEVKESFSPNNLSPGNGLDPQIAFAASKFMKRKKSRPAKESDEMAVSPSKKSEGRKSNASKTSKDVHKIINGFRLHVKDVLHDMRNRREKDEDEEFEESLEKEQEEWKSVARTVDKLFFRLYMFLMILSYVGLAIVAIHGNFTIALDV